MAPLAITRIREPVSKRSEPKAERCLGSYRLDGVRWTQAYEAARCVVPHRQVLVSRAQG